MSSVHIRIGHDDDLMVTQFWKYQKSSWIPVPKAVIIDLISAFP